MTEQFWMLALGCSTAVALLFCLVFFVNGPSSTTTNFENWVDSRLKRKLAELELKKLQAQHEKMCPRLTDTPRS